MARQCERCNAAFSEDADAPRLHDVKKEWSFHDVMKEWSCCKERNYACKSFLEIPGCKTGKHIAGKLEVAKVAATSKQQPVSAPTHTTNSSARNSCSRCRQSLFCSDHGSHTKELKPKSAVSANTRSNPDIQGPKQPQGKKIADINQPQICRNKGCGLTFKEKDNHDTSCTYHPGPVIFHDRMRGSKSCIDYTYDAITKRGTITTTQTPICVDNNKYERRDQEFIMTLTKKIYLPCLFFDEDSKTIVHRDFDTTLSDKVAMIAPITSCKVPNADVAESKTYWFIIPVYKKIIKSLIKFVMHIHKKGKSLKGLTMKNLCISKERLKIWGVRFKTMSDQSASRDFAYVHDIIYEILGLTKKTIVERNLFDVRDLLQRLSNSKYNKVCLKRHWSLLSTKKRLEFIRNNTYKKQTLNAADKIDYENAVQSMGNKQGWTQRFEGPNPKLGPAYDCYHHPGGVPYTSRNPKYAKLNLLRFCRNMATHLLDYLSRHTKISPNDCDVETVISNEFGLELFQVYTHIQHFNLEKRFL